jgi:hypothetical protein
LTAATAPKCLERSRISTGAIVLLGLAEIVAPVVGGLYRTESMR